LSRTTQTLTAQLKSLKQSFSHGRKISTVSSETNALHRIADLTFLSKYMKNVAVTSQSALCAEQYQRLLPAQNTSLSRDKQCSTWTQVILEDQCQSLGK